MIISVVLQALTGSFDTDLKRSAKNAERSAKQIEKAYAQMGDKIGKALVYVGGPTGLGLLIKRSIDSAAALDDLSQKTGIAVESLSRLQYAAGLEGVEDLGASLDKLAKNIATNSELFEALGIKTKNAKGELRTTEDVLLDLAELFSKSADGTRKQAIALEALGKTGTTLIPFLNRGAAGIRELEAEADRLGVTITSNTASAADDFGDSIYRLEGAAKGAVNQLTQGLLPSLNRIASAMVGSAGGTSAFETAGKALGVVLETISVLAANVAYVFNGIGREIGGIAAQAAALASGDFKAIGAIRDSMIEDAQLARKRVDELSASIVNLKKETADSGGTGNGVLPDVESIKKAASEAAAARKKAADDAQREVEKDLQRRLDAEEKQRDSIKAVIDRLEEEKASIGASKAEIDKRTVALLGADEAQQQVVFSLSQSVDIKEKEARATKAMTDATVADTIALEASARAYQRQIDDFGKGPKARRFSAGQNEIDDELRSRVQALQADSAAGLLPDGIYDQELARLQKFHQDASQQWRDYYGKIEEKNSDFTAGVQESFQSYIDAASNLGTQLADGFLSVLDQAGSAVSDLTARFILFGEGGKAAIAGIASQIAEGLLSNLIDVGIQYLKNSLIQKAAIASTTAVGVAAAETSAAAQVAANTAITASAAPAAAATSLASFGANAFPAIAGILAVAAAAAIFTNGFKEGGYTGNNSTSQVSGVVHGQEFVANAKATAKYRGLLEQMNAGVPLNLPDTGANYAANMERGGQTTPQNIRLVNAFDTSAIGDYLQTSEGEKVFLNLVRRNGAKIRNLSNA